VYLFAAYLLFAYRTCVGCLLFDVCFACLMFAVLCFVFVFTSCVAYLVLTFLTLLMFHGDRVAGVLAALAWTHTALTMCGHSCSCCPC